MINIITSFYLPKKDIPRENELKKTLNQNLTNPYIKRVHLFLDKEGDSVYINSLESSLLEKIKIVRIGPQPLYSELFGYANTLPNEICMICNGDIWIGGLLGIEQMRVLLERKYIFSLTRHEIDGSPTLIHNNIDSYDAFVFKSPINPYIQRMVQHKQNIWGAENCVIDALIVLRYNIINPCIQFKIIHEHDMTRPNRIEENRPRMKHRGNTIRPCLIHIENKMISIKKYIQPRFRLF